MRKSVFLHIALFLLCFPTFAQETSAPADTVAPVANTAPYKISFPDQPGWNNIKEGEKLEFQVNTIGGTGTKSLFSFLQGRVEGIQFDSLGRFSWTPGYDFVDRLSNSRTIQFIFEARNDKNERVNQAVELMVEHVNRSPQVGELKPFYVRYNTQNSYTIESSVIKDEDGDPVVIVPITDEMPEGAKLSEQGEFTWKPSYTQFTRLNNKPIMLGFYAEDQPSKARTKGHFKIEVTRQDLPPSILMIPAQNRFQLKEDGTANLKFQLVDPNGDNDIASFSFIAGNTKIPANALVKNTGSQYEFIWKPGYDFVKDPLDSLSFNMTFFVLDKSNKRDERTVSFTVLNAVNEDEKDLKLYTEYRSPMVRAWDLMEQLKAAEKDLKKKYNRARKGKKSRSITNASLGAVTGIAPVVVELPETTKKISVIGGTMVMTIGTLEATEVIGRSTKDLTERLNYIIEKRNELQTKGDIYARKYALKSSRRRTEFIKDTDEFVAVLNLKGMVALELDANWQNKTKASNDNIAKTFKDYNPLE